MEKLQNKNSSVVAGKRSFHPNRKMGNLAESQATGRKVLEFRVIQPQAILPMSPPNPDDFQSEFMEHLVV